MDPALCVKCPGAACLTFGSSSLSFRVSHPLHCSGCYTHRHAHALSQHSGRHVHLGHIFKHAWEQAPSLTRRKKYTLRMKRQGNINRWLTVICLSIHKLPTLHYITFLVVHRSFLLFFFVDMVIFQTFHFYSSPKATGANTHDPCLPYYLFTSFLFIYFSVCRKLASSRFKKKKLVSTDYADFWLLISFFSHLLFLLVFSFLLCLSYLLLLVLSPSLVSNPFFLSYISLLIPFSCHLFSFFSISSSRFKWLFCFFILFSSHIFLVSCILLFI